MGRFVPDGSYKEKIDAFTYGQVTFKASHNSYGRNETLTEQLTWNLNGKTYNGGCRGLELDIWRRTNPNFQPYEKIDESYFQVGHDSPNKGNLKKWLQDIYDWHLGNLNHDVVLITLDIKSTDGSFNPFPAEIDTYLDNYFYFGANIIFKPKDLIGESTISLFSYVKDNGWPTLEKMKGKFIFCLSGTDSWKNYYATMDIHDVKRNCFVDSDISASSPNATPPEAGSIVFFNFHIYQEDVSAWRVSIPKFAKDNLIVRAYIANSETNWKDCLNCGVSVIATDKVSNNEWAEVSSLELFAQRANSPAGLQPEPAADNARMSTKI